MYGWTLALYHISITKLGNKTISLRALETTEHFRFKTAAPRQKLRQPGWIRRNISDDETRAGGAAARSNRQKCQSWRSLAIMWRTEPIGGHDSQRGCFRFFFLAPLSSSTIDGARIRKHSKRTFQCYQNGWARMDGCGATSVDYSALGIRRRTSCSLTNYLVSYRGAFGAK